MLDMQMNLKNLIFNASVVQLVERLLAKEKARGFESHYSLMFYKDIPVEQIPQDVRECYKREVEPYIGQLVIFHHKVYRLLGLIRDDKFDGEWCYRLLVFPSEYEWRREHWDLKNDGMTQVIDPSILCGIITPLKGFIPNNHYENLEDSWKMNEGICPYSKDYSKYE